jgi:hypothetical protein
MVMPLAGIMVPGGPQKGLQWKEVRKWAMKCTYTPCSICNTLSHTHTFTCRHTLIHTHTHILSHSHTDTHTHILTHIDTQTHTPRGHVLHCWHCHSLLLEWCQLPWPPLETAWFLHGIHHTCKEPHQVFLTGLIATVPPQKLLGVGEGPPCREQDLASSEATHSSTACFYPECLHKAVYLA